MRKTVCLIMVILLMSLILISSFQLYKIFKEYKKEKDIFENLTLIVNKSNNEEKNEEKANSENQINIEELYSINKDIVGWIRIENTNIDYPVMQTIDRPNYYLRKNFYKEYSYFGTPYLSENCNIQTSDNLIIYGHNIKENKMFGELENYKNEEYYKKHKNIKFYTLQEVLAYEIIAVFKTVAYTGFEYYKFYNAQTEREFETFIKKCKELSFYDIEESAKYGDNLITLSTCEYSNKNGRLVIVAKKIL